MTALSGLWSTKACSNSRHSQAKHGLVYEGYLGDGDSNSYNTLANPDHPIYPDIEIKKLECFGHVQKRMGKRLIDKVNKLKGKPLKEGTAQFRGIGGTRKLTQRSTSQSMDTTVLQSVTILVTSMRCAKQSGQYGTTGEKITNTVVKAA